MGEQSASLLEAAVETSARPMDEAGAEKPRQRLTRRSIAIAVVGALVVVGGTVGVAAWASKVAHDNALAEAEEARGAAAHAVAAHRATVVWLETAVATGISLRDGVASGVLGHQDVLGGADAVGPVADSRTDLGAVLTEVLETDDPTADTAIPSAIPFDSPATVDPELGTEALDALAIRFERDAGEAEAARLVLAVRADDVDSAVAALEERMSELASTLPAVHQALLDSHPLASEQTRTAAAGALAALGDGHAASGFPALFEAYAAAASGLVAAHDAEAARIAAEAARVAAEEAAKKARRSSGGGSSSSGGGGGGGGAEQRGVLTETNAQRAANSLGALSWNGTLASRSCAFAAELAAKNGGLYHSSFAGGFSAWGENVAYGYGSASAVVAGWMGSSGHRANILGSYSAMGACSATSSTGRIYWVQQFGA
jgi:uncharacterized protein YkwD